MPRSAAVGRARRAWLWLAAIVIGASTSAFVACTGGSRPVEPVGDDVFAAPDFAFTVYPDEVDWDPVQDHEIPRVGLVWSAPSSRACPREAPVDGPTETTYDVVRSDVTFAMSHVVGELNACFTTHGLLRAVLAYGRDGRPAVVRVLALGGWTPAGEDLSCALEILCTADLPPHWSERLVVQFPFRM